MNCGGDGVRLAVSLSDCECLCCVLSLQYFVHFCLPDFASAKRPQSIAVAGADAAATAFKSAAAAAAAHFN